MAIEQRSGGAFLVSLAAHAAIAMLVMLATRSTKASHPDTAKVSETTNVRMVWLNKPGPSGGGGGGGNRMKEPPRRAELPGHDARTVPATPSLEAEVSTLSTPAPPDREPVPEVVIPVETLALGTQVLPGAMDAPPDAPTSSQGTGKDGGARTGVGGGDGPGHGRGFGDGLDAGTDGNVYRPGAGVTMPIELRKGMAQYTTEAIRARAQGARSPSNAWCSRTASARTFASSTLSTQRSVWIRRRSKRLRSGSFVRARAAAGRCRYS